MFLTGVGWQLVWSAGSVRLAVLASQIAGRATRAVRSRIHRPEFIRRRSVELSAPGSVAW